MQPIALSTIAVAAFAASTIAFAAQTAEKPAPARAAQTATAGLSDRAGAQRTATVQTRSWAKADTNGDYLISPDEMEAYLKANPGPLHPAGKTDK
jgi:hypothetical protein